MKTAREANLMFEENKGECIRLTEFRHFRQSLKP